MTIATIDALIAAPSEQLAFCKTASRTTVAGGWFTDFDLAGNPGAGTLAIGNTANGVVPTDATAGYPAISAFGASARGHIYQAVLRNSVISTVSVYDRVFAAGAYAFNANTNLATQPSFASRVSLNGGAANYNGLELWVEQVTAATGNQAVNVTYTNQAGTGSRTTGAVGIGAAPTVGRCWKLPLQAGDSGVQRIDNVTGSVASAGTFNVMVLRPLVSAYIDVAGKTVVQSWQDTALVEVFADSALYRLVQSMAGTALGTGEIGNLTIKNG